MVCLVPFHVEISSTLRHARAFNLGEAELRQAIVEPWLAGRPVELGEREWEPAKSTLKILEGAALEPPELSFGQGWANAERSAENVTRRVLGAAAGRGDPTALVVESDSPEETVAQMTADRDARRVGWREARDRVDGRDPEVAAVILVTRRLEQPAAAKGEEPRSEP
jgi:hypothetical protein